jgi:Tfp pilus assembly protein PilO
MEAPQKQLVGAGIIALALFSGWAFMIPGFQELRVLRAALAERRVILSERSGLIQRVAEFKKEYQQKVTDTRKFAAVVPTARGTAELISAIERIGQSTGVQVLDVNILDESKTGKEEYGTVAITMKGTGSYDALMRFLDAFEKNIRLIDVQSIDLGQNERATDQLVFGMKASAYLLK